MSIRALLILFAIISVCLVGYFYNTQSTPSTTEPPSIDPTGEKVVSKKQEPRDEMTIKLCNTSFVESSDWYPSSVYKCGDYYEVFAPRNVLDGGSTIMDQNGEELTMCGGLPSPSITANPLCQLDCNRDNLCDGVVIDCSNLLPVPEDGCNIENAVRTGDPKYCDLLKTDAYDADGCREYAASRNN